MPLTETIIKNAKPKPDKPNGYKISDEKNMYLLVHKNGSKYFRLKYFFNGKENTLALGTYPEISLKEARLRRDEAKRKIAEGIDPNFERKIKKLGAIENTFQAIALEWYERNMTDKSDRHQKRITSLFNKDLFPWIGNKPITEIKAHELLVAVQRIESRGVNETARRALQISGQIFRYAIATGRADADISQYLKGALKPSKTKHLAALTEPKEVRALLQGIDQYSGSFVVKCALQFAALVFVRPGELRLAKWEQIDFETKEWRYLVTKTDTPHIVPLSRQAVNILQEIQVLTGQGVYVFPSLRTPNGTRPLSDAALLVALRRIGFSNEEMTVHGFRAMARTILEEVLKFDYWLIEHQLAHSVRDQNGRAYNRTSHLAERHKMMQVWADYLDSLKNDSNVIPFKKTA